MTVRIRVEHNTKLLVRRAAAAAGISISEWVRRAFDKHQTKRGGPTQ